MGVFKDPGIYKGPGIYKTGAASGGGGRIPMPEGYEQIEKLSILSGGERGILLNLENWNNPKICIEFVYTTDNDGVSFTFNGSGYFPNSFWNGNRYLTYHGYGTIGTWPGEINITRLKDDATLNKVIFSNSLDWNGRLFSLNFPAFSSFSMGSRPFGNICLGMDLYNVLVRDSYDNIVFFGVPAKRILDEVEGILDVLTNTFITP